MYKPLSSYFYVFLVIYLNKHLECVFYPTITETYVLVHYWPDEECTYIVHQTAVIASPMVKQADGCVCTVKIEGTKCDGCIAGICKFIEPLYVSVHAHSQLFVLVYLDCRLRFLSILHFVSLRKFNPSTDSFLPLCAKESVTV